MDLIRGCFLAKMCVKTKELGPVGGGGAPEKFKCRSANANTEMQFPIYVHVLMFTKTLLHKIYDTDMRNRSIYAEKAV